MCACILQECVSAFIFKHPQGVLVDVPACDIPHVCVSRTGAHG